MDPSNDGGSRRGRRDEGQDPARRFRHGVSGRTSLSPQDGSPDSMHHSPEPSYRHAALAKANIFSNSRRGLRHTTQSRGLSRPKEGDSVDPKEEEKPEFDTRGTAGKEISLVTNYFQVRKNAEWALYQYRAEFDPAVDDKLTRKAYLRAQRKLIGPYIFDGTKLFTAKRISVEGAGYADNVTFTVTKRDETRVRLELTYQGHTEFGDPVYLQFYNLIVRKCLFGMGLEEMGRNFYDSNMAIDFPALRIQLWPGYITSLENHEEDILLCVEVTHKVIRTENVLSVITAIKQSGRHRDVQAAILNVLQEAIVMTHYNKSTYRVRGVDFQSTPQSSFATKSGAMVTYMDYYNGKHQLTIQDPEQPLIIAKQTRYDPRQKEKDEGIVMLIPELCQFTGLTESMRANFTVMKELAKHLHMSPVERIKAVKGFMTRLQGCQNLMEELADWGFVFETEMLRTQGRVLPKENIIFANGSTELPNDQADWTAGFRSQQLLAPKSMTKWIIIVTKKDAGDIDNLVRVMQKVSGPLGFDISRPSEVITILDSKTQTYLKTVDQLVNNKSKRDGLQMVFIVLATSATECYAAVKKRLVVDYGIPSQCFLAKNLKSKGLMSIATKMCVQMCTKLGGEPWTVKFPLKSLMVIGFDTYGKKSPQISSMVASLSATFTKYYSTIFFSSTPAEQLKNSCMELDKCIHTYKTHNGKLPDWILIYRDGLRDGDESSARETKVIEACIDELYAAEEMEAPKFTYVLVSKKIDARLIAERRGRVENVPPGTIIDHTITRQERYDFFLVSTTARQGTASPCSYNVIRDTSGMVADKLQLLTYKLCHLYFNWSGTVAVPAPCQYAHKLAALTAVAYERPAHSNLSELLYYL